MNPPVSSPIMAIDHGSVTIATGLATAPIALDQYSFFQALREIERRRTSQPRIGYALRPGDEPVRIGQPAELSFAPSTLMVGTMTVGEHRLEAYATQAEHRLEAYATQTGEHRLEAYATEEVAPIVIQQRFLGLLGPSGPMPLHITEVVRDRKRHAGDDSLQALMDIFHHRAATLFYRAWSDAQPIVQRDRPDDDRFAKFVGSLVGIASPAARNRDACPDDVKLFHAGQLTGNHRHAEGLSQILSRALRAPTRVKSFALRTLVLAKSERTALTSARTSSQSSRHSNCLGRSAQLGQSVPDRTSMIDVTIGPTDYATFQQLLPGADLRARLSAIVRHYVGPAIDAKVAITLHKDQVPRVALGKSGQLGRSGWLGSQPVTVDRDDYRFEVSTCGSATSASTGERS